MNPITIDISFITPLFSYGAFNKAPARPEIRVPSIRGVLRWWAEALLQPKQVVDMFGGAGNPPVSSQFVLRVVDTEEREGSELLLPHPCDHQSPKNALRVGSRFTLAISQRSNGKPRKDAEFLRVIKAWLMMGALGGRSNRGAGSFCWASDSEAIAQISNADHYQKEIDSVLDGTDLKAVVLPDEYSSGEDARGIASNTISGGVGNNALGNIRPRVPSPLKFRVVRFGERFRIVAVWDGRGRNNAGRVDLKRAIDALVNSDKEIGRQLKMSSIYGWCQS